MVRENNNNKLRTAYQKATPKSDEQAFNLHLRQNVLSAGSGSYYTIGVQMQPIQYASLTPVYSNASIYNSSGCSMTAPTIHAVSSVASSDVSCETTVPPINELTVATGQLKFFNQQHQYGFIVSEKDGADIFFHYDDVKHTLLSKEFLRHATENYDVRFSFQILDYIGKYESSKKAVNINLLSIIAKSLNSHF